MRIVRREKVNDDTHGNNCAQMIEIKVFYKLNAKAEFLLASHDVIQTTSVLFFSKNREIIDTV
jgi:hypothetical protein